MSTTADIDFLEKLGRQLETVDERPLERARRRRRLLAITAATLAIGVAVLGAVGGWSRWIADGAGGAGEGPSGGGQAGPGSVPSPANPGRVRLGPADVPDVPVLTGITADPSGRVWLTGRTGADGVDPTGWVAYLEDGAWRTLPLPEKVGGRVFAPVSPADVWFAANGGFTHWDGATTTTTSVPFLDGDVGWPTEMTATASDDVWAVGHREGKLYKSPGDGPGEHTVGYLPVAMHWDGSAWADPQVPEYPGRSSELVAVSASGGEAWAVGYYSMKLGERELSGGGLPMEIIRQGPIVVRWTGDGWAAVGTAGLGAEDLSLCDVKVLGPNDVWVLGGEQLGGTRSAQVIAHWDGGGWTRLPSPDGVRKNDDHPSYRNLSATSDTDLWLAGDGRNGGGDAEVAHWDGSSWRIPSMTEVELETERGSGSIGAAMADIVALSPTDVWFNPGFTSFSTDDLDSAVAPLAHWDGATWSLVATPDASAGSD
jgi:hypothetical protein